MGSKTNPIPMVYIGSGPDLPIGGKNGDIYIRTTDDTVVAKIDGDEGPWTPISSPSWSSTTASITIDADDFNPTVFGKTLNEIEEIIENEEKLRKENEHLKEVLKVYEQVELGY